jgi:hypothetical protein
MSSQPRAHSEALSGRKRADLRRGSPIAKGSRNEMQTAFPLRPPLPDTLKRGAARFAGGYHPPLLVAASLPGKGEDHD